MKKVIVLIILFICFSNKASAVFNGNNFTLPGRVIDNNGVGVPDTYIHIHGFDEKINNKMSNNSGYFELTFPYPANITYLIQPGSDLEIHPLKQQMILYDPLSKKIRIPKNPKIQEDIKLYMCRLDYADKFIPPKKIASAFYSYIDEGLIITEIKKKKDNRIAYTRIPERFNILHSIVLAQTSNSNDYSEERKREVRDYLIRNKDRLTLLELFGGAFLAYISGENEKALKALGKVKKYDPNNPRPYVAKAAIYIDRQNMPEKGIKLLKESLRKVSNGDKRNKILTAGIYNNLGVANAKLKKFNEAISNHEKSKRINEENLGQKHPLTLNNYYYLSKVYKDNGDYEKSEKYYRKLIAAIQVSNNRQLDQVIYPINQASNNNARQSLGYTNLSKDFEVKNFDIDASLDKFFDKINKFQEAGMGYYLNKYTVYDNTFLLDITPSAMSLQKNQSPAPISQTLDRSLLQSPNYESPSVIRQQLPNYGSLSVIQQQQLPNYGSPSVIQQQLPYFGAPN